MLEIHKAFKPDFNLLKCRFPSSAIIYMSQSLCKPTTYWLPSQIIKSLCEYILSSMTQSHIAIIPGKLAATDNVCTLTGDTASTIVFVLLNGWSFINGQLGWAWKCCSTTTNKVRQVFNKSLKHAFVWLLVCSNRGTQRRKAFSVCCLCLFEVATPFINMISRNF